MTMKIETLDKAGYRKFGLTTGLIVVILFGLLLPWLFNFNYPKWPWVLAAILAISALVIPIALKPVYAVWMRFGLVMGWINSRIILAILFYGMFLPVGIIMKILGKDPMRRKLGSDIKTYRVSSVVEPKENIERPY